jgi:hypothetical protein
MIEKRVFMTIVEKILFGDSFRSLCTVVVALFCRSFERRHSFEVKCGVGGMDGTM